MNTGPMNARAVLLLSLAAIVPAGCTLKSPPERADVQAQALPGVQAPDSWRSGAFLRRYPSRMRWLADFADPRLDALVAEALANNPDLLAAAARVEQAAAYVESAASALYPQVAAMGNVSGKDSSSGTVDFYGVFASWELDLWGKIRSGREAASLQLVSVRLAQAWAQESMAAMMARAWFVASEARLQKAVADDMVAAAREARGPGPDRQRVGIGNEYDVSVAQASLATSRDAAEQLGLSFRQSVPGHRDAGGPVSGRGTRRSRRAARPARPGTCGPALRTARKAPRRDRGGTARRHRLLPGPGNQGGTPAPRSSSTPASPASRVTSWCSRNRTTLSGASAAGSACRSTWAVDSKAEIKVRTAEQKEAVAEYGRAGANAFAEVEQALSAGYALEAREPLLQRAVTENGRALELAEIRYRVGSDDLRAVQQQQMSLFSAKSALLRVQSEQLVQRINLHLALGGSFESCNRGLTPSFS